MRISIFLILLLPFSRGIAQTDNQGDDYLKVKKIISAIDTIVTPNGIQESFYADIENCKQWINVRGKDKDKPILLFIHGGPGSPLSPFSWTYQRALEEFFIVVNYDQRGAGKTYLANDTTNLNKSMSVDFFVNDAIAIAKLVSKRYNKRKIILVGHSWGTIIAMKAVIKNPDLFYAYVGMGQVINFRINEKLNYEYGLAKAKEDCNEKAIEEMMSIYPYPGERVITKEEIILARKWPQYYGELSAYRHNSDYYFNAALLSPHYSLEDVYAIDSGVIFTLEKLMDELSMLDLSNIKKFPIPVFMFCGRHDYTTATPQLCQQLNGWRM